MVKVFLSRYGLLKWIKRDFGILRIFGYFISNY